MIAQLTGTISSLGANWVVLDVQGVGFKVSTPPGTAGGLQPGSRASLATSLVVREDSLTLYGFATPAERDAFELLQTSPGIGPRIAVATISVLSPGQLVAAIRGEDVDTLVKVPGIGRKGAQKMVLDLREKVLALGLPAAPDPAGAPQTGAQPGAQQWREQVSSGLQGLGWSFKDAEAACDQVADLVEQDPQVSLGSLMKAALQKLARA